MTHSFLCVGGPRDGRRLISPDEPTLFAVPEIEYKQQMFDASGDIFVVWAPKHHTPRDTLELLLERYEARKQ